MDHIFVFLQLVCLFCEAAKNQAQLVLTAGHFVVMFVNFHAKAFHRR